VSASTVGVERVSAESSWDSMYCTLLVPQGSQVLLVFGELEHLAGLDPGGDIDSLGDIVRVYFLLCHRPSECRIVLFGEGK